MPGPPARLCGAPAHQTLSARRPSLAEGEIGYNDAYMSNEKIDWNKVTIEGQEPVADLEETTIEAQERIITPEILADNVEQLQTNIGKIDEIPKSVLESPEGQEETKSLGSRIAERVKGMGQGITEKIAKMDDWKFKDKFQNYAMGAGGAMLLGPAVIQWARTQWPEVGAVLDSAPDALQQIIHFDVWTQIANLFGDGSLETMWKAGTPEVNNLLADIASGKIDVSALSGDQMQMMRESIGNTADLINNLAGKGNVETAEMFARSNSLIPTMIKGWGNSGMFAAVAAGVYGLSGKIGGIAKNRLQENA